jgi:hypothetical protein
MTRAKRKSKAIPKAEIRLSGLAAIDKNLDFGNGFSLARFRQAIEQVREQLSVYNVLLSHVDHAYRDLLRAERELSTLTGKMLLCVAVTYGRDSAEYEMVGGKRRHSRFEPPVTISRVPEVDPPEADDSHSRLSTNRPSAN